MLYATFANVYPKPVRDRIKNMMRYTDITIPHETLLGMGVTGGIVLSIIVAISMTVLFALKPLAGIELGIVAFLAIQGILYIWLVLRADAKAKFVELILPDALLLMSMNIKSGITTDRALIMSARPEFGPLEKELSKAGKQLLAGKEMRVALISMTTNIKSSLFDRTVRLIIEGIESGGELSTLLQHTAEDIQTTTLLQNEVRSSVLMYAFFILFAVGIGAPMLFGISTYLVGSIGSQTFISPTAESFGSATESTFQITAEFLVQFALIAMAITSIFAGMIVGIIREGTEKSGIKMIPVLFVISVFIFFAVRSLVSSIFPGFVG